MNALLLAAAALLAFLGSASLALSVQRNWISATGLPPTPPVKRIAGRAGWIISLAALPPCVLRDGAGFAALTWPLLLAAAAFSVAMILSFRPGLLRPIASAYLRFAGAGTAV